MDEDKRVMYLWGFCALVAFIAALFIPIPWVMIVHLIFDGLNVLVLASWAIAVSKAKRELRKQKRQNKE